MAQRQSATSETCLLRNSTASSDGTPSAASRTVSMEEEVPFLSESRKSSKSTGATAATSEISVSECTDNRKGSESRSPARPLIKRHSTKILFDMSRLPSRLAEEEDSMRPTMEQESCAEALPEVPRLLVATPLQSYGASALPTTIKRRQTEAVPAGSRADVSRVRERRRHSWGEEVRLFPGPAVKVLFAAAGEDEEPTPICPRVSRKMSQRTLPVLNRPVQTDVSYREGGDSQSLGAGAPSFQMSLLRKSDNNEKEKPDSLARATTANEKQSGVRRISSRTLFQLDGESAAVIGKPAEGSLSPARTVSQDRRVSQRKTSRTLYEIDSGPAAGGSQRRLQPPVKQEVLV